MGNLCKGVCDMYGVFKLRRDWHNLGLKVCRNCQMCFEIKYRYCPCCKFKLSMRTTSGNIRATAYPVRYVD